MLKVIASALVGACLVALLWGAMFSDSTMMWGSVAGFIIAGLMACDYSALTRKPQPVKAVSKNYNVGAVLS